MIAKRPDLIDVVVVGGGAMGSAAAWQLTQRGVDVVLLERFAAGHVMGASHGASRIFRLAYPEPDYIALARRALPLWRELEQASGLDLLTLTGGVDHGDQPALAALAQALAAAGAPGQWLSAQEATERWPGMRFDGPALFHPDGGRVHADRAVAALQRAAAAGGAQLRHETAVVRLTVRGDEHVEIVTQDTILHARRVVVAAGAWSAKLLAGLVALPPLRVTQEQPAHFAPLDPGLDWPSFIHQTTATPAGAQGVHGLRTPGAGVKIGFHGGGPVCDPDARDFLPEPAQLQQLRQYVRDWMPGVDADAVTPISCTYTSTPSSDFVLDRVGPLVVAAGFSGHGFKFTPAIGELLARLTMSDDRPPARFALPTHGQG